MKESRALVLALPKRAQCSTSLKPTTRPMSRSRRSTQFWRYICLFQEGCRDLARGVRVTIFIHIWYYASLLM